MAVAQNIIIFYLFLLLINPANSNCPKSFECGHLGTLEFPLTNRHGCGLFMVENCDTGYPFIQFEGVGHWYALLRITPPNQFLIFDPLLVEHKKNKSCSSLRTVSLPDQSPSTTLTLVLPNNLTVFTCQNQSRNSSEVIQDHFENYNHTYCSPWDVYYTNPETSRVPLTDIPSDCSVTQVPRNLSQDFSGNLWSLLSAEFVIEWNVTEECYRCHHDGGECLTNSMNQFHCYIADSNCPKSFDCGHLRALEFPFTNRNDCGLFMVQNCSSEYPTIQFGAGGPWYNILKNISANKFLISDPLLHELNRTHSCLGLVNSSLPQTPSTTFSVSPNLTVYSCLNLSDSHTETLQDYFENYNHTNCSAYDVYYRNPAATSHDVPVATDIPSECLVNHVPIKSLSKRNWGDNLFELWSHEYVIEWNVSKDCYACHHDGGKCLTNAMNQFHCDRADSRCPASFECGGLGTLEFPLSDRPGCGLFLIENCTEYPVIQFEAGGHWYGVLGKISTNRFFVFDRLLDEYLNLGSCLALRNLSLPAVSASATLTVTPNLTMFTCLIGSTNTETIQDYFENYNRRNCSPFDVYYRYPETSSDVPVTDIPSDCSMVQVPINSSRDSTNLLNLLTPEYVIEWNVSEDCYNCHHSGGKCLTNSMNIFHCERASGGVVLLIIGFLVSFIFWQRKKRRNEDYLLSRNLSFDPSSKSDVDGASTYFGIPIFSYTELEEATSNFDPSKELGDGGFGTVYYGEKFFVKLLSLLGKF
ncbi:probable serine/threonine-protein kinase at1g18390 [Phtheirospermum japonicum]|uniref:Probable serine/threonine-protein kinase at1g18390 n=1 Tax=Phtheirospermum japonicum TaxID=374723 RepID=A0A830BMC6_9LAMI|nr:probable serine/threonine-protein kinase at1g18390 [Phtheirospermum japonicum]